MSRLRVCGGVAGGRVLREPIPPGVRPTSARVREALFSIVGQDLTGQTVLDAFGGSGIVGLEAWSRGAAVTVVEKNRRALSALRSRGEELGAEWTVRHGDVLGLASELPVFDGIFVDPPYADEVGPVVATLGPLARRWLVLEAHRSTEVPGQAGSLALSRSRRYGGSTLHVYR